MSFGVFISRMSLFGLAREVCDLPVSRPHGGVNPVRVLPPSADRGRGARHRTTQPAGHSVHYAYQFEPARMNRRVALVLHPNPLH
jgi:hypothetical protein